MPHSKSGWSAIINLLVQLVPLLDSIPRVWCNRRNPFFLFLSLPRSKTCFTCFIKDVPHFLPLLIYSVFFFVILLIYVTQGLILFLSCRTKAFLVLGSCSLLTSYLGWRVCLVQLLWVSVSPLHSQDGERCLHPSLFILLCQARSGATCC